jgi:hypothetical protein
MAIRRTRDQGTTTALPQVDAADLAAVGAAVQDLAEAALGTRPPIAQAPEALLVGFGVGAFGMRLAVDEGPWSGPLVARDAPEATLTHEAAWLRAMQAAGFPVPALVSDPPGDVLVFRQPEGDNLAGRMVTDMPAIPAMMATFGAQHAQLHALPTTGLVDDGTDPLDVIRSQTDDPQVQAAVRDEIGWLARRRPPTKLPVPCNGELNPVHVYPGTGKADASGVIVSWAGARLADAEFDVAATITAFWSAAHYLDNVIYRKAMKMAREPLIDAYLNAYRAAASRELDAQVLRYWQVHHLTGLLADTARKEAGAIQHPWDVAGSVVDPSETAEEIRTRIREMAAGS